MVLSVVLVVLSTLALVCASPAFAGGAWWHVQLSTRPSVLPPGGKGQVVAFVSNLGYAASAGEVSVSNALPSGLQPVRVEARIYEGDGNFSFRAPPVVCAQPAGPCVAPGGVPPFAAIEVRVQVTVRPGATVCAEGASSCETSAVSVSGGGVPAVAISRPISVEAEPAGFGVESYEVTPEEAGGAPVTQAGKHPFQVTGALSMNQNSSKINGSAYEVLPVGLAKDLAGLLPAGLIGNPTPFVKCSMEQFPNRCPAQSVVGVAMVSYDLQGGGGLEMADASIDLLEPAHGEAAKLGFEVAGQKLFIDATVRSGEDYAVRFSSSNITQALGFVGFRFTIWGVPGEAEHDATRGLGCLQEADGFTVEEIREHGLAPCAPLEENDPPPFLAMPTSCTGPLQTSIEVDSWSEPRPEGTRAVYADTQPMPAMDGCNKLPFEPEIRVTPDGGEGSTPTGLDVQVHVPQDSVLDASSLAQSALRDTTVELPAGVVLNAAGAGGLEACPEGLIGFEGFREFATSPGVESQAFTPRLPGSFGSSETLRPGINFCSDSAKIGTVTIRSPLLPATQPLTGAIYLATQESNPFGSLVALYIVAEDQVSGSLVKLAGETQLCQAAGQMLAGMACEAAGQIVSTFRETPQLAFEDLHAHFFGGERAPLASPAHCGAYTTAARFVPWSAEPWDQAAVTASSTSTFAITTGPHGTPCPGSALPFSPSLVAGTTNNQAGGFSPFTMTISRESGQQGLNAIELKTPPGLAGLLSSVQLCPEPQASQGLCPGSSLIGETTVSVGVGGQPFSVKGGKVYITGPYRGAPFGLSIVDPAKAGPFDLEATKAQHPACDCVVVRAQIHVDPTTAALTVTSDREGPFAIPTSLEGIPLQIQHVNVTINRSGFIFNPTNCSAMSSVGTLTSSEGSTSSLLVPFQVANCAALAFAPKFSAFTQGKTSRLNGASLKVKLSYPAARFGTQANIKQVKVSLPRQLPSRLTTLNKACLAAQFRANPAGCPSASVVGHAKAITPLLPVPLEGPAYFVSNGGEAFPNLIIVLQGDNVTVDLVGSTFISKKSVTTSTFKMVPDAPVSTFELTLPEGRFSALSTSDNLCNVKNLIMPASFTGQNEATVAKKIKLTVTGCKGSHRHAKVKNSTRRR
jgi:hypothetical protein